MHALAHRLLLMTVVLAWSGPVWAEDPHHGSAPTAEAHAVAADHAEPAPDITHFDPMTYVWELALFLVLFAVLAFAVWPKMLAGLQAREQKQLGDLQTAENAAREAQATLAEYKRQLAEARQEAQAIVEQSRSDAQQLAQQLKQEAQHEITQMRQRAQHDIAAAGEQAVAAIYERAASLSTQIAGRILQRELDPAANQSLVNDCLQQLSARRN